jgi:hypothetical protein
MGGRQLLAPIAAHKGEGDAPRNQRIGDAAGRLAGQMSIEQRSVDNLTGNDFERITDICSGADHGQARLFENAGNIQRDKELVFNDENARCCHPAWRLSLEAQLQELTGFPASDQDLS